MNGRRWFGCTALRPATRAILLAVLVAAVATGCVGTAAGVSPTPGRPAVVAAASATVTVSVGATTTRTAAVRSPEHAAGTTLPVIIAMHGAGGSAQAFEESTGFTRDIVDGGFIAVYPQGTAVTSGKYAWNAGTCCALPLLASADDVGFLDALMSTLVREHNADPLRIYLTGFSNGGMMAYRAACELGGRIAGIAVVAGALNVTACANTDPVPLILVHGTADTVVPYTGGDSPKSLPAGFTPWTNAAVADAVAAWTTRNGCADTPLVSTGASLTTEKYPGCADGAFVTVYRIAGGEHSWPQDPDVLSATGLIEQAFIAAG